MCGIVGVVGKGLSTPSLKIMVDTLRHRGPDGEGLWICKDTRIGLGHTRLAILDRSQRGKQPAHSVDRRYVLVFNGEIYNHLALRRQMGRRADAWKSHCDTETLVEAIALWGVRAAIEKCEGMFALAVWDRHLRTLWLMRDRFGQKPLYYGWAGGDFVFGSELKALRRHPGFSSEIDRSALGFYVSRGYVPAPLSIHRGLFKLPPGCILRASADALGTVLDAPPAPGDIACRGIAVSRYWSYADIVAAGLADPIGTEQEGLDGLRSALDEAVAQQSVADVPTGILLSGGLDSTIILALLQARSGARVHSFSIGFEDPRYDEAVCARRVAAHFGTTHHERYITARDAIDAIAALPYIYDEPFADSCQIPMVLLSAFARDHASMVLTGDGADELFGGYPRYRKAEQRLAQLARAPRGVRAMACGALSRLSPDFWTGATSPWNRYRRPPMRGETIAWTLGALASASDFEALTERLRDRWPGRERPVRDSGHDLPPVARLAATRASLAVRLMHHDAVTYLPDDLFCKVDRASMAVGLEARSPFADHRLAEVAARIPISMKLDAYGGKRILRRLLDQLAPSDLVARPKQGFSVPIGEWLRGPLREWAEELLGPPLAAHGYLNATLIRHRWQRHLSGERDHASALWSVLMFQAWLRSAR